MDRKWCPESKAMRFPRSTWCVTSPATAAGDVLVSIATAMSFPSGKEDAKLGKSFSQRRRTLKPQGQTYRHARLNHKARRLYPSNKRPSLQGFIHDPNGPQKPILCTLHGQPISCPLHLALFSILRAFFQLYIQRKFKLLIWSSF